MEDLNEAGGVYAVMNEINKLWLTAYGAYDLYRENRSGEYSGCVNLNPEVIRPVENPYSKIWRHRCAERKFGAGFLCGQAFGGRRRCCGTRAPARVFDCEEDAMEAITSGKIQEGDVVVIRYEGPKGGPEMREMLNPTSAIMGMGLGSTVAPDYRRAFQRRHQRSGHRPCFPRRRWEDRSRW